MQKLKLFVLYTLPVLTISLLSFNALFATPLKLSSSKNIRMELDFPNDEKKVFVRRITEHVRGGKKISLLYGIQVIDERGRRYYVQDDYDERNFVCRAFNFEGAFNERSGTLTTPIVALSEASQTLKFDEEENDLLVPYRSSYNHSISRLEVLPCRNKS